MSDNTTPASWRVDSQTPRTRATSTGNVEDGYDIAYVTGEGHAGTVFVPARNYTVDKVKAVIQEAADKADSIGALTSDS